MTTTPTILPVTASASNRSDTAEVTSSVPFSYRFLTGNVPLAVYRAQYASSIGVFGDSQEYLILPANESSLASTDPGEEQRFWFARNTATRRTFVFDTATGGRLLAGSPPIRATDALDGDTVSIPERKPTGFLAGDTVPGYAVDQQCMFRVGVVPTEIGSTALCPQVGVYAGVIVVADASTYVFPSVEPPVAVLDVSGASLRLHPTIAATLQGLPVWYIPDTLDEASNGVIGTLGQQDPVFLSPIPYPTESPVVTVGQRDPLDVILVDNETELAALTLAEGQAGVALSTGLLRLPAALATKADTGSRSVPNPDFDVNYLGAPILYRGIVGSRYPVPMRQAVALVDSTGATATDPRDAYIPLATYPSPIPVSGITWVPDGTGTEPNTDATPNVRPNGCGLVRSVDFGGTPPASSDLIISGALGSVTEVRTVLHEKDVPRKIPPGVAYVVTEAMSGSRSRVFFNSAKDLAKRVGPFPWGFRQAAVTPCGFPYRKGRLVSAVRGPYTLDGTETLALSYDGSPFNWHASALGPGSWSASEVAASVNTTVGIPSGLSASSVNGFLYLAVPEPPPPGGPPIFIPERTVTVLSGGEPLGFLERWSASNVYSFPPLPSSRAWLPQTGVSFGLHRSLVSETDFVRTRRLEDEVLAGRVGPSTVAFLRHVPLEDRPGYDAGTSFFRLGNDLVHPFVTARYRFESSRVEWLSPYNFTDTVGAATTSLMLAPNGVAASLVPETLEAALGGSIRLNGGQGMEFLEPGADIQVQTNTATGTLINPVSLPASPSFRIQVVDANTLVADSDLTPFGAAAGDWLVVDGTEVLVIATVSGTTVTTVSATTAPTSQWVSAAIHPARDIVVDTICHGIYQQWSHLGGTDPWKIRTWTPVNTGAPTTPSFPVRATDRIAESLTIPASDFLVPSFLSMQTLGVLENNSLLVPSVADPFTLYVQDTEFIPTVVNTLDPDPVGVQVLDTTGEIRFPSSVLSKYPGANVVYVRAFSSPAPAPGFFEVHPVTGEILVPALPGSAFLVRTYDAPTEVATSPLSGALTFRAPLDSGTIVQSSYWVADAAGNQTGDEVTEFLPALVRQEVATRVDPKTYTFNPTSQTVFADLTPTMYVGALRQNYGPASNCMVDFETSRILFNQPVDASQAVKISYAVLECPAGSQSFNTTLAPVWRPTFLLPSGATSFTVPGDATGVFAANTLVRVGSQMLAVTGSAYNAGTAKTTVTVLPPSMEIGSRSPGNDPQQLLSDRPVSSLDMGAYTGITLAEPAARGVSSIVVTGSLPTNLAAGHIVGIAGYYYTVSGISDTGRLRRLALTEGLGEEALAGAPVLVSARPLYPPNPTTFVAGNQPVLSGTPRGLIRFPSDPALAGALLREGVGYRVDESTGYVQLLAPNQAPLQPGETLCWYRTDVTTLAPTVAPTGDVVYPRYAVTAATVSQVADTTATLRGTYTYYAPDTFYAVVATATPDQTLRGILGPRGAAQQATLVDGVARRNVALYNAITVAFEQVVETANGQRVGDRDGKFRIRYEVRGIEDVPYTGSIDPVTLANQPRNVWTALMQDLSGLPFVETDPIVEPTTAVQNVDDSISGSYLTADRYRDLLEGQQVELIQDEVEDRVLVNRLRPSVTYGTLPPFQVFLTAYGRFEDLAEPNVFSRLFPERATAFTTLDPGIGATDTYPGIYSYGSLVGGVGRRTTGSVIGTLSNPVLGVIPNLTDVSSRPRRASCRVLAYSPVGFPEQDGLYGTDFASNPRPAAIVTVVLFDQIEELVDGFPHPMQFVSGGGSVPDVLSGDASLSVPPMSPGLELRYGTPDGSLVDLGTQGALVGATLAPVAVDEVFGGCVLTFAYSTDGSPITRGSDIIAMNGPLSGSVWAPVPGDTILAAAAQGVAASSSLSDPPTTEELANTVAGSPDYRTGFDVRFRLSTGEVVDATLPSFNDPTLLGLKEITGQNTPDPMSALEATVEFKSSLTAPLEIPALRGESLTDDGQYSVPYLSMDNEIARLRDLALGLTTINRDLGGAEAEYPDEIGGAEATVQLGFLLDPTVDFLPTWSPGSGTGPLRPYDLLLVESPNDGATGLPVGSTGILSVGSVDTDAAISPPRFVTPTAPGAAMQYTFDNAMGVISTPGYAMGVTVLETVGVNVTTELSIASTPYVFDDNAGGGTSPPYTGGFNDFFDAAGVGSSITIEVLKRVGAPGPTQPGEMAAQLIITKTADGGSGIASDDFEVSNGFVTETVISGTLGFGTQVLFFETANPVFDFTEVPASTIHEFLVSFNAAPSSTEWIDDDRLTFRAAYDLRGALPRGTVHPLSGLPMEAGLSISTVDSSLGATTVNSNVETNGGMPWAFIYPGTFGGIRVTGFEGHDNTVITAASVSYRTMPTATVLAGVTAEADGLIGENRVTDVSAAFDAVRPGDLLVVTGSTDVTRTTTKAGTYVIRYAVPGAITLPVALPSPGWIPLTFPTFTSYDVGLDILVVSDSTLFDAAGSRVYVILDQSALTSTDPVVYATAAVSATYTGILLNVLVGLTDYRDAAGNVITASDFDNATSGLTPGNTPVSGFTRVPVDTSGAVYPHVPGNITEWTLRSGILFTDVTMPVAVDQFSVPGDFTVYPPTGYPYSGTPEFLDISGIPDADWDDLHDPSAVAAPATPGKLYCLLPSDIAYAVDASGDPSFLADCGIYIEPSMPTPVQNLTGTVPRVVTTSIGPLPRIGFRLADDYGTPPFGVPEVLDIEVRRARRWQGAFVDTVADQIRALLSLYVIRTGTVVTVVSDTEFELSDDALLGTFDARAGDQLRINDVSVSVDIASVDTGSGNIVRLARRLPGVMPGDTYEVFFARRDSVVPVLQSCKQLEETLVETVFTREVDYSLQEGGFVPATGVLEDVGSDFVQSGIRAGDYVLIDPAGALEGPSGLASPVEYGAPPMGDIGINPATGPDQGGPSETDDNRGWYRVVSVDSATTLTVEADPFFAGPAGSTSVLAPGTGYPYVLYPTVSNSALPGSPVEGQGDLRVTAYADPLTNSFKGTPESVAPFGYRIVRPLRTDLDDEMYSLLFAIRERVFSWTEALVEFQRSADTYDSFQRDDGISDLSTGTIPNTGLADLQGELLRTPFENNRKALSVLDRRHWLKDLALDFDGYTGFLSGDGLPVLPDQVEGALDADEIRQRRYAWLDTRVNRVTGTLSRVRRGLEAALEADKARISRKLRK